MPAQAVESGANQELFELVGFLGDSSRQDVQKAALDIVVGLTASQEGINRLKPAAEGLLSRLFRLLPDRALSGQALAALVNLSQDDAMRASLVRMRAVSRIMEAVREKTCPHLRLLCMLLANLTVGEPACEELLQLDTPGMEGLHMALLLKLFITSAVTMDAAPAPAAAAAAAAAAPAAGAAPRPRGSGGGDAAAAAAAGGAAAASGDPCEHLGAVITNVTRLKKGREMLLEPGRGLLQALASQLAPGSSEGRRRGCSGALRNCCLSAEADGTLGAVLGDEAVLLRMLGPISGGAASDPDDNVREALAEAVAVLAAAPGGKAVLLPLGAAEQLRAGYESEEHPGVCAAMEAAGRSLFNLFGEAEEGEGEEAAEAPAAGAAA
ncbi:hypothetical protein Rsub_06523 [Raphidocelis subcapitata]|uniref:Protein HGH1 N-terminal domain-containing protein n=1 Tax=Raphidocelis subcapitata TaxID=307507 RepID=A0A2V0P8N7_9CHLO|nr:hypothetical protein Rsub_06523 [Raphidocelis subcapitata]|eukprot:GBF94253.1 hypothetical protein Rsub_06523 [Raphidocelis subcapitata]